MAVYTEVTDAELARFMREYDLGEVVACKGIAEGVENSNYLLRTDHGRSFILTLYERRVAQGDLPYFLGLMDHLAARGFACPTPIPGCDGETLRRLCGRPAAIVSFLEGLWPRDPEPFHSAGVGAALARLHCAGADFPLHRANDLGLDGWRRLIDRTQARADEVVPGLAELLASEIAFLEAHWPAGLPAGVVHADMFPDNVFFRDRQVSGVIDFYFACNEFLAYDVAVCLNAWGFDRQHRFDPVRARLLIAAYCAIRPLGRDETEALAVLARGAALRFLLTRLHDWLFPQGGALVRPKDPREYVAKLRYFRTASGGTFDGA